MKQTGKWFCFNSTSFSLLALVLLFNLISLDTQAAAIFNGEHFTQNDAVLVSNERGEIVYQWQAEKSLIPASLTKLVMSYLAINKWGLEHRFVTEFYLSGKQLWVKGYGDPYLISEEIDLVVKNLKPLMPTNLDSIHIDSSYFQQEVIPGSTKVNDPYNAPVSAVAANFNTVMLQRFNGQIVSAEAQTQLTRTAQLVGKQLASKVATKATRINLQNVDFAQQYFAELLLKKLDSNISIIKINQTLPVNAELLYQHVSSYNLADILRGALKYSNNFIANQLFILIAEELGENELSFSKSENIVKTKLANIFAPGTFNMVDGAGLSRKNQFSAHQLNTILTQLQPHAGLLKEYKLNSSSTKVFAKTGTLNDVHCFAGFLEVAGGNYQFAFIFNRVMPNNYRMDLLQRLADQLGAERKTKIEVK